MSIISKILIKAVVEQTTELDELGGFASDDQKVQYVRDVNNVARRLQVAEELILMNGLKTAYASHLSDR